MAQRIAVALALVVFVVCLLAGLAADNPFDTVVMRATLGMLATLVIGLVLGAMAQKMLEENLKVEREKIKNHSAGTTGGGR